MSVVDDALEFNRQFVEGRRFEQFAATKVPAKGVAILSCMDTRLTELLPAALGFRNGHVQIIKDAGALISHPFGAVMRSVLVSVYKFDVKEIMVIGHHDCGMQGLDADEVLGLMLARGIDQRTIDTIDFGLADVHGWLEGFRDARVSVEESVRLIAAHPLMPSDVHVSGYLMDPVTGRLDVVIP